MTGVSSKIMKIVAKAIEKDVPIAVLIFCGYVSGRLSHTSVVFFIGLLLVRP